jgi:plasmid stability protein
VATLKLRDLDETTYAWLRSQAAAHGQSVNAELLDLIATARADHLAAESASPFARCMRRARVLGVRTPATSRRIVRADRDR